MRGVCAAAAPPLLSLISNQLNPRSFLDMDLFLFLSLSFYSSSLAFHPSLPPSRHFTLRFSPIHHVPPPFHNPCPVHFIHWAFYQLIHSFCSLSGGLVSPIPLYLHFSCCSIVSLPLSVSLLLSLWFLSIRPRSRCICTETQTHTLPHNLHIYARHTRTDPNCFHNNSHTLSPPHGIMTKFLQGSNLTEVFNWINKKVILSFN